MPTLKWLKNDSQDEKGDKLTLSHFWVNLGSACRSHCWVTFSALWLFSSFGPSRRASTSRPLIGNRQVIHLRSLKFCSIKYSFFIPESFFLSTLKSPKKMLDNNLVRSLSLLRLLILVLFVPLGMDPLGDVRSARLVHPNCADPNPPHRSQHPLSCHAAWDDGQMGS